MFRFLRQAITLLLTAVLAGETTFASTIGSPRNSIAGNHGGLPIYSFTEQGIPGPVAAAFRSPDRRRVASRICRSTADHGAGSTGRTHGRPAGKRLTVFDLQVGMPVELDYKRAEELNPEECRKAAQSLRRWPMTTHPKPVKDFLKVLDNAAAGRLQVKPVVFRQARLALWEGNVVGYCLGTGGEAPIIRGLLDEPDGLRLRGVESQLLAAWFPERLRAKKKTFLLENVPPDMAELLGRAREAVVESGGKMRLSAFEAQRFIAETQRFVRENLQEPAMPVRSPLEPGERDQVRASVKELEKQRRKIGRELSDRIGVTLPSIGPSLELTILRWKFNQVRGTNQLQTRRQVFWYRQQLGLLEERLGAFDESQRSRLGLNNLFEDVLKLANQINGPKSPAWEDIRDRLGSLLDRLQGSNLATLDTRAFRAEFEQIEQAVESLETAAKGPGAPEKPLWQAVLLTLLDQDQMSLLAEMEFSAEISQRLVKELCQTMEIARNKWELTPETSALREEKGDAAWEPTIESALSAWLWHGGRGLADGICYLMNEAAVLLLRRNSLPAPEAKGLRLIHDYVKKLDGKCGEPYAVWDWQRGNKQILPTIFRLPDGRELELNFELVSHLHASGAGEASIGALNFPLGPNRFAVLVESKPLQMGDPSAFLKNVEHEIMEGWARAWGEDPESAHKRVARLQVEGKSLGDLQAELDASRPMNVLGPGRASTKNERLRPAADILTTTIHRMSFGEFRDMGWIFDPARRQPKITGRAKTAPMVSAHPEDLRITVSAPSGKGRRNWERIRQAIIKSEGRISLEELALKAQVHRTR